MTEEQQTLFVQNKLAGFMPCPQCGVAMTRTVHYGGRLDDGYGNTGWCCFTRECPVYWTDNDGIVRLQP